MILYNCDDSCGAALVHRVSGWKRNNLSSDLTNSEVLLQHHTLHCNDHCSLWKLSQMLQKHSNSLKAFQRVQKLWRRPGNVPGCLERLQWSLAAFQVISNRLKTFHVIWKLYRQETSHVVWKLSRQETARAENYPGKKLSRQEMSMPKSVQAGNCPDRQEISNSTPQK